jgi:hypothetical protein
MGVARLGPHRFRLDPKSISWDFKIHAVDVPAVGGKVVQVLRASLGDMTVTGSFGVGGWREQEAFLEEMKSIGSKHVEDQKRPSQDGPIRFRYPPMGWNFLVYLKGFTQPGARGSIQLDDKIVDIPWQLTLFIVEDNNGLTKVTKDAYIARLAEGIGWKQTKYNGPMSLAEVQETFSGGGGGSIGGRQQPQ